MKEQSQITGKLGKEKLEQCRSNDRIECRRHKLKMEDDEVKCEVQEQCRNNGKLGRSMEEQTEDVGENDQHETQTRNSGARMRMTMVVTMVIAVATIVVFANGVIVGSLNGIRPDVDVNQTQPGGWTENRNNGWDVWIERSQDKSNRSGAGTQRSRKKSNCLGAGIQRSRIETNRLGARARQSRNKKTS